MDKPEKGGYMEKVLIGIGVVSLCTMFYCIGLFVESESAIQTILAFVGVIVSATVAIYTSNSVEFDDDAE